MLILFLTYVCVYIYGILVLIANTKNAFSELQELLDFALKTEVLTLPKPPSPLPKTDIEVQSESLKDAVVKDLKASQSDVWIHLCFMNLWFSPFVLVITLIDREDFDKTFKTEFKKNVLKQLNEVLKIENENTTLIQLIDRAIAIVAQHENSNDAH